MTAELDTEPKYTPHQPQAGAAHAYDLIKAQEQLRAALRTTLEDVAVALPPIGSIQPAVLSESQIAEGFDSTGKGRVGTSYHGWAIANGNNGTPNLSDRFVRLSVTSSGATGGSDTNSHTHDKGTLTAQLTSSSLSNFIRLNRVAAPSSWNHNYEGSLTVTSVAGAPNSFGTEIDGSTSTPSDTENRPAFYTAVALIRVGAA